MRPLAAALALALVAAPVAAGDVAVFGRIHVQAGSASGIGAAGPTPIPRLTPPSGVGKPPGAVALERPRPRPRQPVKPRPPRRAPFLFFPHGHHGHHDHDDHDDHQPRERIVVVPVPEPRPLEPEAAPPPPPDPRGSGMILPARGAAAEPDYALGEPLPAGVPFVTLHWRQYDFPEPPAGLVYARVGRDVLLIDPVSRVVERRVEPSEFPANQG